MLPSEQERRSLLWEVLYYIGASQLHKTPVITASQYNKALGPLHMTPTNPPITFLRETPSLGWLLPY